MASAAPECTLEAALRAIDPHDLWVPRGGRHGADILERGGTSWHGWLGHDGPDQGPPGGTKDVVIRAAYDDVDGDGEEDAPITVTGTRNVNEGTGDETGSVYGAGFYPGSTGYEMGGGGDSLIDPLTPNCVGKRPTGLPPEMMLGVIRILDEAGIGRAGQLEGEKQAVLSCLARLHIKFRDNGFADCRNLWGLVQDFPCCLDGSFSFRLGFQIGS
ncbi:MAG TPA: hypothetical protein VGW40_12345 [Allosphingosinicella sp.]|nr:hypothetical protein [Allosphingosinicella sp.]